MLEVARRKDGVAGTGITFALGDVTTPALREATVDVVLARYILWLLREPVDVLRRWSRLLRPGGTIVLIEDRWWPGPGGRPRDLLSIVGAAIPGAAVHRLEDGDLWGDVMEDERVAVVSHPR